MDMVMVDVTEIPGAKQGDEVIIFEFPYKILLTGQAQFRTK
jgi:alanine racemase